MASIDQKAMLEAGVHFGHLRKKWNPKMLPYIFAEKKGIHVIDLNKTASKLEEAGNVLRNMAKNDKIILFVATKKQAKDIVKKAAMSCEMPFVTERWLGGMLTNFATIRKSVRKMQSIDKMFKDGTVKNITKKERLMLSRQKDKLEKVLGGIANLNRIPNAVFVVDILHEDIAITECKKLSITTLGMVDTNSDPNKINFAIPSNDDSSKSIEYITTYLAACINEGKKEKAISKEESASEAAPDTELEVVTDTTTTESASEVAAEVTPTED
ncbi:MAG: 30S ribosomal protein S2 [Chitinophagales bacterium]|jgi:small subunit ribosomal protein S2|nr:30S ribosomal protein S2 [Sphingobacteriales bacterium]